MLYALYTVIFSSGRAEPNKRTIVPFVCLRRRASEANPGVAEFQPNVFSRVSDVGSSPKRHETRVKRCMPSV